MPKKTFEIARRQGAGLIVSVKADKPGLLREMQESFGYFNLKPKRFNFVESGVPVFKEYAVLPVNERTLGGQPEWGITSGASCASCAYGPNTPTHPSSLNITRATKCSRRTSR